MGLTQADGRATQLAGAASEACCSRPGPGYARFMSLWAGIMRVVAIAGVLMAAAWCSPALACMVHIQPEPAIAKQADAVVVGNVTRFRREGNLVWQITGRGRLDQENRARMTVEVDEAISGSVAPIIIVYWHEMTNNGPPDRVSGSYILALKKRPDPSKSGEVFDVVQGICTGASVYPRGSPGANAIRAVFGLGPEPSQAPEKASAEIPWPALAVGWVLGLAGSMIAARAVWRRRGRKV